MSLRNELFPIIVNKIPANASNVKIPENVLSGNNNLPVVSLVIQQRMKRLNSNLLLLSKFVKETKSDSREISQLDNILSYIVDEGSKKSGATCSYDDAKCHLFDSSETIPSVI